MLEARELIELPATDRPILLVVVDTEEEFDWSAEFDRAKTSIAALERIPLGQEACEEFGIRPTYLADYPVIHQARGLEILGPYAEGGRAELGVQLHAWVTPPFEEPVSRPNSYQGNLDPGLERRKLAALTEAFERGFGFRPRIHKAGRYGFGEATAATLLELGYQVDMSPAAAYDYRADGGPDFRRLSPQLYWLGADRGLLGVPATGAFIGPWRGHGPALYSAESLAGALGRGRAHLLSRLRMCERILLSPEGHSLAKLVRLTRALLADGLRVFHFSFHSPSLLPGMTCYAGSESDVRRLLDRCRAYFEFFLGELGGTAMTPGELRARLRGA